MSGSKYSKMEATSKVFNPESDMQDLTGKVALVTGANKGIGLETVKQLALKGARVYLGARDETKASNAMSTLEAEGVPRETVHWLWVDLSTPEQAKQSAERFLRTEGRLDILVNNAAMPASPYKLTSDGIVDSVSTKLSSLFILTYPRVDVTFEFLSHLGPFVLTNMLLPLLYETAHEPGSDVRIVNLTSAAHTQVANIRVGDIQALNISCQGTLGAAMARHGFSRLLNILFTKELQRRLDEDGASIIALCLHPGTVWTDTAKQNQSTLPLSGLRRPLLKTSALTPARGAHTTLFAAASPTVRWNRDAYRGKYLIPFGELQEPSETARDTQLAKRLWETSEKILTDVFSR